MISNMNTTRNEMEKVFNDLSNAIRILGNITYCITNDLDFNDYIDEANEFLNKANNDG